MSSPSFLTRICRTCCSDLAFYTIFSLPSMLFIVLWTAARVYKEVAVREAIFTEFGDLVGKDGTQQLMALSKRSPSGTHLVGNRRGNRHFAVHRHHRSGHHAKYAEPHI